jgi:hypothetical protein
MVLTSLIRTRTQKNQNKILSLNTNSMKKILGSNPLTSAAGLIVAGLLVAKTMLAAGETNYWNIGIAVAIAVLGRVAGDTQNSN